MVHKDRLPNTPIHREVCERPDVWYKFVVAPAHKTFRTRVANRIPGAARPKRFLRAMKDSGLSTRRSYSEHGEDRWLLDHLGGTVPSWGTYIDVGAHHPTRGSNTYLFYRLGLRGVLVEPNLEFAPLHRRFRPEDVLMPVGCGRAPGARPFLRYSAAANSSFTEARVHRNEEVKGLRRVSQSHTPILPLDIIAEAITSDRILMVSIDVEGLEDEVLDGGAATLARTDHVIIEALSTNPGMEERIEDRMGDAGFSLVQSISYNRIYSSHR